MPYPIAFLIFGISILFSNDARALVNGRPLEQNSDLVRLKFHNGFVCTGFFIDRESIVTAGHCLKGQKPSSVELLRAGETRLVDVKALEFLIHPLYVAKRKSKHDLGVIHTTPYAEFQGIYKIGVDAKLYKRNMPCVLHGAGKVNLNPKKYGFSQGENNCRSIFDMWLYFGASKNTDNLGKNVSTAPNDSGAPILNRDGIVIGIQTKSSLSWTFNTVFPSWSVGVRLDESSNFSLLNSTKSKTSSSIQEFISTLDREKVEYYWQKPEGEGAFPVMIYVHGHQEGERKGGKSYVDCGVLGNDTKKGFVSIAISLPGYGHSSGPADFSGPRSKNALISMIKLLKKKPYVNSKKIFVQGISRGAIVAALVAMREDLGGAILISGAYNLSKLYEDISTAKSIKSAMREEMRIDEENLVLRSASLQKKVSRTPFLVIHGETDSKTPFDQAEEFYRRMKSQGAEIELRKIKSGHKIPLKERSETIAIFIRKVLAGSEQQRK
ncbi:MAG: trypsin-like serine protease [Bdellovibrionales bacterium]|nr:trypsin-like serine protease [Bdellovibrionales bacterium]